MRRCGYVESTAIGRLRQVRAFGKYALRIAVFVEFLLVSDKDTQFTLQDELAICIVVNVMFRTC